MFHERIKHSDVHCHFIRYLLMKRQIVTPFVQLVDQLGDILTKSLAHASFQRLSSKLGMFNVYALA